jgi:TIR domain
MLITVQFPIFDARGLQSVSPPRLAKPNWPHPRPGQQFVRGFGGVVARKTSGLSGFFAEDRLCTADLALRIAPTAKTYGSEAHVAFRHLFADGDVVVKLEVGFAFHHIRRMTQLRKRPLSVLLDTLLRREVVVGPTSDASTLPLANAGKQIAALYAKATTHRPKGLKASLLKLTKGFGTRDAASCFSGQPLVSINLALPDVRRPMPGRALDLGAAFISSWEQKVADQTVKVVVIAEKGRRTTDVARNLRIFINRIHAELLASEYGLTAIEAELRRARTRADVTQAVRKLDGLEERRIKAVVTRIDRAIAALCRLRRAPTRIPSAHGLLELIWDWRLDTVLDRYLLVREQAARLETRMPSPRLMPLTRLPSARSDAPAFFAAATLPPEVAVFLSYRREDTRDLTGRIGDFLERCELRPTVFRDVASIEPGSNWRAAIDDGINASHVVLPIFGPNWAGRSETGRSRIEDQDDWVRYEIETALVLEKNIVPIVVQGCDFPPSSLPRSLTPITALEAFVLDPVSGFERGMHALVTILRSVTAGR